jgi:hypothetical protein
VGRWVDGAYSVHFDSKARTGGKYLEQGDFKYDFRRRLETPAMTAQDEADIIAFIKTLNDGYEPAK